MEINKDENYWHSRARIMGMRIQMMRKLMELNQYQFALKLGVSFMKVHRWEAGKYPPNAIDLLKISDLCGRDVKFFYEP